jgi:hypothetical protein
VALVGLMSLKIEQISMHTTETPVPVAKATGEGSG